MKRPWLVGTVLIVFFVAVGGVAAQGTTTAMQSCQPVDDKQLCIEEFDTPDEPLVVGEHGEFSVTVTNDGEVPASGMVLLHTANPENNTSSYRLDEITLGPGESETLSRPINATTPGTHGLRISVHDAETGDTYDISEIATVEILEEPPKRLGGPIDRTEIALGALIVALGGIFAMGYRYVTR